MGFALVKKNNLLALLAANLLAIWVKDVRTKYSASLSIYRIRISVLS